MSYILKKHLANKANYGSHRNISAIEYFVIHYTSNDGDTDENNGKYFANNVVKASAHYFIDDDSITQSVPDDYVAYAVGGKKYANCGATGGGKFYGKCTNANSLSFEICDDVKDGVVSPSDATFDNVVAFVKLKMKEYNIPIERVIRHFDVTGKSCPAYFCGSKEKDAKWEAFKKRLTGTSTTTSATTTTKVQPLKVTGNIKSVQTYLKQYYGKEIKAVLGKELAVDGLAGPNTRKALAVAFQVELNKLGAGLKVDGDFGTNSKNAFVKFIGILQKGSTGIFVTLWQCTIVCYHLNPNGIDGDFGSGCRAATYKLFVEKGLIKDYIVNGVDIASLL